MNQIAQQQERLPMDSVGMTSGSTGAKIAPQNLAEVVKFAEVMCRADIALPKHLRGNAGACMAVAIQALDWQMNPFAVASKSYQVNGAIAYEAQLIAAVVNTRSGIKGRLKYDYDGDGDALTCTVTGTLDGEEYSYTSPPVGSITTKNSPLWKSDVRQQLGYFSARSWARRYTPEVILGVYDRDEAEQFRGPDNARDVTPRPSLSERLKQAPQASHRAEKAQEGFDATIFGQSEDTPYYTDKSDFTDPGLVESPEEAPDDACSLSSSQGSASEDGDSYSLSPSSPNSTLVRFARDVLNMAANPNIETKVLLASEERWWKSDLFKLSDEDQNKARAISKSMRAVEKDPEMLEGVMEHYAEVLECGIEDLKGGAS